MLVDSCPPSIVVPLITGSPMLAGGSGTTTAVAAELADPDPPALLAVTTERIVFPMSEAPNV